MIFRHSPEDLGNGMRVVYQVTKADAQERYIPVRVRAVVKNAAGEIIARGPLVGELDAGISRDAAVSLYRLLDRRA
jgi:hypothetical protein